MGKNTNLESALAEKDSQIARLEFDLQIYAARTSQMHTHLLSTLDDMDDLRSSHERELACETRAKLKLSEKLDRYVDEIKVAERSRDDMKEIVSIVLKKEKSALFFMLIPLDPLLDLEPVKTHNSDLTRSFTSALISSLREELDAERRAHKRTRDETAAQILELNAKLARRDAELEAYVVHPGPLLVTAQSADIRAIKMNHQHPSAISRKKHDVQPTQPPPPPLAGVAFTAEEATRILGFTAARNKVLELEVQAFSRRLEEASRAVSHHAGNDIEERGGRERSGERATSRPPDGNATRPPQGKLTESFPHHPPDYSCRSYHPRPLPTRSRPELNDQIDILSSGIDAFKRERGAIREIIAREGQGDRAVANGGSREDAVLLVQDECARLMSEIETLRQEVDVIRLAGERREEQLQKEIDELRREMSTRQELTEKYSVALMAPPKTEALSNASQIAQNAAGASGNGNSENDEESMELETPYTRQFSPSKGRACRRVTVAATSIHSRYLSQIHPTIPVWLPSIITGPDITPWHRPAENGGRWIQTNTNN
ncbi:hypothetical protein A0H81_14754 [Grifola frondosa]|uniref:Uncharacterized protein n=1 Tax=Grifola frondosa TaxID=5627 RepID=A0A1C7LKK1_GRIFR|nr:hypothetical protein A0H81_14754 [Grifola frondosa]